MAKFKHTQGISYVDFTKTITVFCPLGNDYYTADINVRFHPNQWMMDYIDVEKYIMSLQGSRNIIEDIATSVYDYLKKEYSPNKVRVSIYAYNAAHFPVTVVKE